MQCPKCYMDMSPSIENHWICESCSINVEQLTIFCEMGNSMNRSSKYNNKPTIAAGVRFDSKAEAHYYLSLLALQQQGKVKDIELQPSFLLQEAFVKNGEKIREITYKADFRVTYADGHVEIVDVKGVSTAVFLLKRKLFEHRYPDLQLVIVN